MMLRKKKKKKVLLCMLNYVDSMKHKTKLYASIPVQQACFLNIISIPYACTLFMNLASKLSRFQFLTLKLTKN
jgi:hypothetical protein